MNFHGKYKNYIFLLLIVFFLGGLFFAGVKNGLSSKIAVASSKEQSPKNSKEDFVTGELLIKFKSEVKHKVKEGNPEDTGIESLNSLLKNFKVNKFSKVVASKKSSPEEVFSWYKVTTPFFKETVKVGRKDKDQISELDYNEETLKQFKSKLEQDSNIEKVEFNYLVHAFNSPNDPYFSSTGSWGQTYPDLWGLKKINMESVWDQVTSSASLIIADIDSGADRNHEDLADNLWVNSAETPGNGADDDGNGYIDDYYGWNFVGNNDNVADDNGHGTHTIGTIAGTGNNGLGIVGVNWAAKVMVLKFLNSAGDGSMENGVRALIYAADMGAKVSSNSWGCNCQSSIMDDAVRYAQSRGMVTVVAAGNNGMDALNFSPAASDGTITVGASDNSDILASFSNYGEKIDVVAPGVDILSLKAANGWKCTVDKTVGTNYCRLSGTSMATPHVAGLAALIWNKNPSLTNEEIRQILRNSAADLGVVGKDNTFGYGRINGAEAINQSTSVLAPVITSPGSRTVLTDLNVIVQGSVPGPNFASYKVEIGEGRTPTSWITLANSTTQVINGALATFDSTSFSDGKYIVRVSATDTAGKVYQYQVNDIEIDHFDSVVIAPDAVISQGSIKIFGSANAKNGLTFGSYQLEYGVGTNPSSYQTTGITLENNGQSTVTNGLLGTWDTSSLSSAQTYTLRLTVQATLGSLSSFSVNLKVDDSLVANWPIMLPSGNCASLCEENPTLADIDNDGNKEILVGSSINKFYAFRKDGSLVPGFPVTVDEGTYFKWSSNVEDLDGDGQKEIIANAIRPSLSQQKIFIIKSNGQLLSGWPSPVVNTGYGAESISDLTPTIADINNDGTKELVVITLESTGRVMHAYKLDGTEIAGFPKITGILAPYLQPAVAIDDMDGDGNKEVAFGDYDKFYLLDNQGNVLPGWPYTASLYNGSIETFQSTPAFGDIDGDGQLEIFATASPNGSIGVNALVYGWEKDGTILPGWPQVTGQVSYTGWPLNSPSAGDIDNDGKDEIILGYHPLTIHKLAGPVILPNFFYAMGNPALADPNGYSQIKIGGGDGYWVGPAMGNTDGSLYWSAKTFPAYISIPSPRVVSDLDHNNRMEMVAVSKNGTIGSQLIYLWELPGNGTPTYDWPTFMQNPARTGRIDVVLVASPTPIPTPSSSPTPTPTPTPAQDTISPVVQITNPLNGSKVTKNTNVNITATASDNVGVAQVRFYVNGSLKCTDTASPYSCTWKVPGKSGQSYTLQATAQDTSGNTASNSINVTSK